MHGLHDALSTKLKKEIHHIDFPHRVDRPGFNFGRRTAYAGSQPQLGLRS